MIIYLNPVSWAPEYGGQLGYRNEVGHVTHVQPEFNTAAFIPFRTDCQHWVEPLARPQPERLSVSVHYMDA
jgi:Rps23 Pro-64 3,4-dihydroxylase Tpa1-like proline 4-hydroxylase